MQKNNMIFSLCGSLKANCVLFLFNTLNIGEKLSAVKGKGW